MDPEVVIHYSCALNYSTQLTHSPRSHRPLVWTPLASHGWRRVEVDEEEEQTELESRVESSAEESGLLL